MKKIIFYVLIGMAWPLMAANYSGKCGSSLTWSLDTSTGMLLISGSGAMTDYADSLLPWYNYRASVRSCQISAGVTHLSENMFAHCDSLKQVYYPLSVDYLVPVIECEGGNVCGGTIGTAVDLGLPSGTKWADHNIGASAPEGYGCYFAWGETGVKSDYSWSTYSLCKGSEYSMTKYCTSSSYGTVDNKTVLEASDDAATVNWGGNWRMPTYDEEEELHTQCTWTWTQKNGINGYDVKGPNGKSIFLPAAGCRYGSSTSYVGSGGYYWSSSLYSLYSLSSYVAWDLSFGSSFQRMGYLDRGYGFSVRPVYDGPTAPQVKTDTILSLSDSTAQCKAVVVNTGGSTITQQGFCVSTSPNPSLTSGQVYIVSPVSQDSFQYVLSGLLTDTTYYICAFATNSAGTSYGEVKKYKRAGISVCPNCEVCSTGTIGTAVDLGLPSGTKWADHNVGATNPEDYGCYFAWGETGVKSDYSWSTYSLCNGDAYSITKYCTNSSYGTVDNKTVLEPSDDAAAVNWGSNWRMPTYDELNELRTKCTWTWTQKNGINGYDVKGPNGNSIFLPAAGSRSGTSAGNVGSLGNYWSSLLGSDFSANAWRLYFSSSSQSVDTNGRCGGISVRPVCR